MTDSILALFASITVVLMIALALTVAAEAGKRWIERGR